MRNKVKENNKIIIKLHHSQSQRIIQTKKYPEIKQIKIKQINGT